MAKSPFMGAVVGHAFQWCGWAIPVKKVHEDRDVIVFAHPQPAYDHHIILSPKRAVRHLLQLSEDGYSRYFVRIWEAAKTLQATRPEYRDGFTLVANGGKRQEVQQVHFHMMTRYAMVSDAAVAQEESAFYRDQNICVTKPLRPDWEVHYVLRPASPVDENAYFTSVLQSIHLLNNAFNIVRKGYSLVCQHDARGREGELPVFHIVSGRKRG